MSSFAAASTIPVTNKVAHANSRRSLRILVMTTPPAHDPMQRRRGRTGRRRDGDTSNLAQNARRLDWFPPMNFFLDDYVPLRFPTSDVGRVIKPVLAVRLPQRAAMCPFRTHARQQTEFLFDHLVGAREQQR